jgi:tetratricopeptide (TPR) repeat protein
MYLRDAAARHSPGRISWRRAGRHGTLSATMIVAGVGMALTFVGSVRLEAQGAKSLIGERVVPKFKDFTLRNGEQLVDVKKSRCLFRVERIDGPLLLLKAENETLTGWAKSDSVVPVDQAIEFFNQQVSAHPLDSFPRISRALIYVDKQEYDKAIADVTEAVRLDPTNEHAYSTRGYAWSMKKAYEKAVADFGEAVRLSPGDARNYYNRCCAWGEMKEYEKAITDFGEVIRLDPNSVKSVLQSRFRLFREEGVRTGARRLRRGLATRSEWRISPRRPRSPECPATFGGFCLVRLELAPSSGSSRCSSE